ncbi:hypothetical protein DFR42_102660 [Undibacterium pigrum]|uniref:Uncharacterized protein n=1 Tax=Undibacterium pigrum TaxID=401470 RepID=A0A318JAL5_9BURK|nr:hypothetical protein DFR42_102660 [Undibacterium pigrum]
MQVAFKVAFKPDYLEDRFALVKIACCIYSFFNIFAKFLSAAAAIKEKEKYMGPTKIMIILHAEKPGT